MPKKIELSIIMPCLNEELTLAICIQKAQSYLNATNINGEIIISDNGSNDNSVQIANSLGARVINVKEKGYGSALSAGINGAKGTYFIMGDADDSYDFSKLSLFYQELVNGNDLVVGNRFKGGIEKGAMPFLHKYLGNPVLTFIGKLFFNIKINDFHCGLRGMNVDSYKKLNLRTTGMEFASEMIVKSAMSEYKITEVPTILSKDGRNRPPHLNTWRDGWRHLRFLLLFSPKWLFLNPSLFIMSISSILAVRLAIKPIQINNITLDIHSLAYFNLFFLIGLQMYFFHHFSNRIIGKLELTPSKKKDKNIIIEKGMFWGSLSIFISLIIGSSGFYLWEQNYYENIDPTVLMRLVIPSITFATIGIELILFNFIFGALEMLDTVKK